MPKLVPDKIIVGCGMIKTEKGGKQGDKKTRGALTNCLPVSLSSCLSYPVTNINCNCPCNIFISSAISGNPAVSRIGARSGSIMRKG